MLGEEAGQSTEDRMSQMGPDGHVGMDSWAGNLRDSMEAIEGSEVADDLSVKPVPGECQSLSSAFVAHVAAAFPTDRVAHSGNSRISMPARPNPW